VCEPRGGQGGYGEAVARQTGGTLACKHHGTAWCDIVRNDTSNKNKPRKRFIFEIDEAAHPVELVGTNLVGDFYEFLWGSVAKCGNLWEMQLASVGSHSSARLA
jgi:hypothetical protein